MSGRWGGYAGAGGAAGGRRRDASAERTGGGQGRSLSSGKRAGTGTPRSRSAQSNANAAGARGQRGRSSSQSKTTSSRHSPSPVARSSGRSSTGGMSATYGAPQPSSSVPSSLNRLGKGVGGGTLGRRQANPLSSTYSPANTPRGWGAGAADATGRRVEGSVRTPREPSAADAYGRKRAGMGAATGVRLSSVSVSPVSAGSGILSGAAGAAAASRRTAVGAHVRARSPGGLAARGHSPGRSAGGSNGAAVRSASQSEEAATAAAQAAAHAAHAQIKAATSRYTMEPMVRANVVKNDGDSSKFNHAPGSQHSLFASRSSPGRDYRSTNDAALKVMQRVKRLMSVLEGNPAAAQAQAQEPPAHAKPVHIQPTTPVMAPHREPKIDVREPAHREFREPREPLPGRGDLQGREQQYSTGPAYITHARGGAHMTPPKLQGAGFGGERDLHAVGGYPPHVTAHMGESDTARGPNSPQPVRPISSKYTQSIFTDDMHVGGRAGSTAVRMGAHMGAQEAGLGGGARGRVLSDQTAALMKKYEARVGGPGGAASGPAPARPGGAARAAYQSYFSSLQQALANKDTSSSSRRDPARPPFAVQPQQAAKQPPPPEASAARQLDFSADMNTSTQTPESSELDLSAMERGGLQLPESTLDVPVEAPQVSARPPPVDEPLRAPVAVAPPPVVERAVPPPGPPERTAAGQPFPISVSPVVAPAVRDVQVAPPAEVRAPQHEVADDVVSPPAKLPPLPPPAQEDTDAAAPPAAVPDSHAMAQKKKLSDVAAEAAKPQPAAVNWPVEPSPLRDDMGLPPAMPPAQSPAHTQAGGVAMVSPAGPQKDLQVPAVSPSVATSEAREESADTCSTEPASTAAAAQEVTAAAAAKPVQTTTSTPPQVQLRPPAPVVSISPTLAPSTLPAPAGTSPKTSPSLLPSHLMPSNIVLPQPNATGERSISPAASPSYSGVGEAAVVRDFISRSPETLSPQRYPGPVPGLHLGGSKASERHTSSAPPAAPQRGGLPVEKMMQLIPPTEERTTSPDTKPLTLEIPDATASSPERLNPNGRSVSPVRVYTPIPDDDSRLTQNEKEVKWLKEAGQLYPHTGLPLNADLTTISMVIASKIHEPSNTDFKQLLGDTVAQAVGLARERIHERTLLQGCAFGRMRVKSLAAQMKASLGGKQATQGAQQAEVAEEVNRIIDGWCDVKASGGLHRDDLSRQEVNAAAARWKFSTPEARQHVVDRWADIVLDDLIRDTIEYFNHAEVAGY